MVTKHQPATPLPWMTRRPSFPFMVSTERSNVCECNAAPDSATKNGDAAYIAHAANAYPKLVENLRRFVVCGDYIGPGANARNAQSAARALLRELGEEV